MKTLSLDIETLRARFGDGSLTPLDLVDEIIRRTSADPNKVWIHRLPDAALREYARSLADRDPAQLPLYGIPFAIKDNIDLAGAPTTAGCREYAYTPARHAFVVQQLIDAGAIPVGKTNLDQFATGLNGTRSPYGACRNAFNPAYISGGSSSGSAVAVALDYCSFALGTDTAGSGRVPAAFNNLVGLKPTFGLLSNRGLVPACRTLDCISIFALNVADAADVLDAAAGYDEADPYSLARPADVPPPLGSAAFRFGVPAPASLEYFGNGEGPKLFAAAVAAMQALGGTPVEIDFAPFLETARLLYGGPWIAERYAAIAEFFEGHADALFPVTREIIGHAREIDAVVTFQAQYRLQELKRLTAGTWRHCDLILTPTCGAIYTIAEVEADPVRLNSNLGYYTNFVNLLNMSAIAVPCGMQANGLPFGVTLCAPAFAEQRLLESGARLHRQTSFNLGAMSTPVAGRDRNPVTIGRAAYVDIAVCGAHMSGLALNHELTRVGGVFRARTLTKPIYRLYALPGGPPQRPGLIRSNAGGAAIELEVWRMPINAFGSFVAAIPAPLGIGTVRLADGTAVQGFVCESAAVDGAVDITDLGGWRAYLARA
jgi:allophanate hydrolase